MPGTRRPQTSKKEAVRAYNIPRENLAATWMLYSLARIGGRLTMWEQEFLVSVIDWFFEWGFDLTVRQRLRLEQMYREHF
jgi:hypothetical protein